MAIRKATVNDSDAIADLLDQLDYPDTLGFLPEKIARITACPEDELLVYELDNKVVAFISFHFITTIGLKGDIARINFFCVDKGYRSKGIGREMIEHCTRLANERKCDRIEVHSHSRRTDAHRFYYREGYVESPKYLQKMLNPGQ
jgi:GNAT superfamily N-acetyltransferase